MLFADSSHCYIVCNLGASNDKSVKSIIYKHHVNICRHHIELLIFANNITIYAGDYYRNKACEYIPG